jgi:hypothetical protein
MMDDWSDDKALRPAELTGSLLIEGSSFVVKGGNQVGKHKPVELIT